MNTNEIIDSLNEKTQNKFEFFLKDASLDVNSACCNIEIYYKDGTILSHTDRTDAEAYMRELFPSGFNYTFKFVKNFITKDTIIPQITGFFKSSMPSVLFEVVSVKEENAGFNIKISIAEQTFDYFSKKDGERKLKSYLENYFSTNFNVVVTNRIVNEVEEIIDLPFTLPESHDERFIEISDIEAFIGDVVDLQPLYIKDVKNSAAQDVCVCGKVKFLKELSYERKSKKIENDIENKKVEDENSEEEKISNVRVYYKWVLEGFTGDMNCIYFTNKNTKEIMQTLANGDEIVVLGDLEKDKFSNNYTLKIKRISKCKRPDKFEEKIEWKEENKNYKYIFPEPIEITKQVDLFGMFEEVIPEYLKGKEIVVYDFETTGLSVQDGAKIIEIGAVKIIDGKIKEKFSCMVNPGEHIAEDSTKIHGITDDDVKDAHTIGEVIEDFYKFTRGAILSGYNIIGFDMIFLTKFGKDYRYNFDNEVVDVYKLAMQYVKGTRNYKLGTIAEKLGITLDNAHRAWYDAYATAEVLIKLAENIV